MRSRRHVIRLSFLALIVPAAAPARPGAQPQLTPRVWLPLIADAPLAPAGDMPLLGPPSGTSEQAIDWLAARCAAEYTRDDVTTVVGTYERLGDWVGLDWFLALAQVAHETGHLSSWWAGRPRRNPAGIGVTGETRAGAPDAPPRPGWTWDDREMLWRAGWSFPTWADHAIPAHLGRLLAYALTDDQANAAQQELIAYALSYRSLPAAYRGAAPTIVNLNGKWAVPGTDYGQRIIDLLQRMRVGRA